MFEEQREVQASFVDFGVGVREVGKLIENFAEGGQRLVRKHGHWSCPLNARRKRAECRAVTQRRGCSMEAERATRP